MTVCLVLAVGCPGKGRTSDSISGKIVVEIDQALEPVGGATVTIRPTEANEGYRHSDEPEEQPANLKGVQTSNDAGSFSVRNLASRETHQEYPLLRGWKYAITIMVPDSYVHHGEFTYDSKNSYLTIELNKKPADVSDDTEGVTESMEVRQSGSVRKATQ